MSTSASTRAIAGKIVSIHNRRECTKCQRLYPKGGVLSFGLSGSDPRWYPDEDSARRATPGVRYYLPVGKSDVELDGILAWLERQREEIELMVEHVEREREERRLAREYRREQSGFRTSPWPCADCGHPKHRPADRCDHCGDEPCPLGIDHHEYNRGYGYRD